MTEATPHLRNILDLLEIRGCRTEFQPRARGPGHGAWVIFYPMDRGAVDGPLSSPHDLPRHAE